MVGVGECFYSDGADCGKGSSKEDGGDVGENSIDESGLQECGCEGGSAFENDVGVDVEHAHDFMGVMGVDEHGAGVFIEYVGV